MSRNTTFHAEREPLKNDDALQLDHKEIHGPFPCLNPTQAHFHHVTPKTKPKTSSAGADNGGSSISDDSDEQEHTGVAYKWTSRNNRKGRHAIIVQPVAAAASTAPAATTETREILKGIWRICTYYPVWDVSYLVAVIFTLGSVVWVFNAFFVFYPSIDPSSEFPGEILYGGGITAFIGATIFEIGSVLLMLEAINENRTGCFGWALERVHEEHMAREKGATGRLVPSKEACSHHHANKRNLIGKPNASAPGEASTSLLTNGEQSWTWWPSPHDLRTHYIHDLGFLACSSQFLGATIFWIAGFTALPGIYDNLSPRAVDGAYWTPQVIGGLGFVISGTLFMVETQKHWWMPAPKVLGWHIGLWNLIGGLGFLLSPCFGYDAASWAQYQAGCATFWGSWAFLIGSVIQWYESLDKHPVETVKSV